MPPPAVACMRSGVEARAGLRLSAPPRPRKPPWPPGSPVGRKPWRPRRARSRLRRSTSPSRRPAATDSPSLDFNSLHFMISLETQEITTCAAEQSLMCCGLLKRRLLKLLSDHPMNSARPRASAAAVFELDGSRLSHPALASSEHFPDHPTTLSPNPEELDRYCSEIQQ